MSLSTCRPGGPERGPDAQRLTVRGPGDLVVLVPYLLGFRPSESAVAVLISGRRVVLTARVDLPTPSGAAALGRQLSALARQHGAEDLVVMLFSDRGAEARAVGVVLQRRVRASLLSEVLYVAGRRWWSLTCCSDCCPEEGTPYDPEAHPLAAQAVLAGVLVRPSRAQLAEVVEGPPGGDLDDRRAAVARVGDELAVLSRTERTAMVVELVRRAVSLTVGEVPVSERTTGLGEALTDRLLVLVRDITVRDVAWALMSRDEALGHVAVWAQVVSRAPVEDAAAPLCLLGMAAWIAGDGALLNCSAERVAQVAPTYSMGALLTDLSDRALAPSLWDHLVEDLRAELGVSPGTGSTGSDGP